MGCEHAAPQLLHSHATAPLQPRRSPLAYLLHGEQARHERRAPAVEARAADQRLDVLLPPLLQGRLGRLQLLLALIPAICR